MCDEAQPLALRNQKPLRQLNKVAKRPPVDIEFHDLSYNVRDRKSKNGWRQLLKSINGKFCSGQLTAILGPSGAGKSTLLNILAGYVVAGVKGTIKINESPRNMKIFNKLSSYIMQDDIIQPHLTVKEAMVYAAGLKLGTHIGPADKIAVVNEVLELLGLEKCSNTTSEYLSGGQRKRLAVALELVNNPPVIFLDEPTSGLDNVSIKQCIDLLENITKLGRTVICTIHQPPASLFQTFSQVYVVANGYCVYNGSPQKLVPFLANAGLECPLTYTPADYKLVQSNYSHITILSNAIDNGRTNMRNGCNSIKSVEIYESNDVIYKETTQTGIQQCDIIYPTSTWVQFKLLLSRMLLQLKRNKTALYIQFFHHLLSGLLMGLIFFGIGNNASQTIAIFKYCVCVNVFFMYTHVMAPVLLFPLEVKLMKREYFNRWYSLKAYYLAMTIASLPILVFPGLMCLFIVYFLTNQPLEMDRFVGFCVMGLTVALCSQGLGYAIGSIFNITKGSIVGSSTIAPLLALAVYGMGYRTNIEPFMKALMALSYMRYAVVGFCSSLFDNREALECTDELYCHYRNPQLLMEDMGMGDSNYFYQLGFVIFYMILFRIISYLALKYRLNKEISNVVVCYASKLIKQQE